MMREKPYFECELCFGVTQTIFRRAGRLLKREVGFFVWRSIEMFY